MIGWLERMPLPAVLRRVSKAMPSIFQAIAIVAFIHLVGQVRPFYRYSLLPFTHKVISYI